MKPFDKNYSITMRLALCKRVTSVGLLTIIFSVHYSILCAQYGYSSASFGMGKQRSGDFIIPKSSEIVVEEYFNYHKHNLPLPAEGGAVGMDMRWGNPVITDTQPEAVLQIGFTTNKTSKFIDQTPLNICIVIDRSGSMQGDRIAHALQSAEALIDKLRDQDKVSVVVFDDQIETLLEHESVNNKSKIKQVIKSIEVRGSTDLNGGLIRGYEVVAKNYNSEGNNKVLLLTDVLTNTGQIDPEEIVKNSKTYSRNYEIGITLVAIGVQVNDELARQITRSGKHSFHYVNDSEDIQKIFVNEVESIFSTIAKEATLTIDYESDLSLTKFYGYSPRYTNNSITLDLNNMNAGLTQVVLARFKSTAYKKGRVTATLSYFDVEKKKRMTEVKSISLDYDKRNNTVVDILAEPEVRKCVSLAEMASSLKEVAQLMNNQSPQIKDFKEAKDLLRLQMRNVIARYPEKDDEDVSKVLAMLENYSAMFLLASK